MRIETSSIEIGSSAITTFGSTASARAIATRWRCPPESSCGYLSAMLAAGPVRPVSSSSSTFAATSRRRDDPVDPQRPLEMVREPSSPGSASRTDPGRSSAPASGSGERRGGAGRGRRSGRGRARRLPSAVAGARSRRATVLLPLPLSPTRAVIVPGLQRERHVVDGVQARTGAERRPTGTASRAPRTSSRSRVM